MDTPSSEKPSSITITGITGAVVNVGNNNLIEASIKFKQIKESEINSNAETWKQILTELEKLQSEIKSIPDQHEEIRDVNLVPELARAKVEAKQIIEDPSINKTGFVDKLTKISEVAGKVVDIGGKLSPFIITIGKLLGITI